jgi:hypothetical protein
MYINRSDLERAVVAEEPRPPAMLPGEYAGRLWLRLNGIDPDTAHQPSASETDVRALERAREVLERRQLGDPVLAAHVIGQLTAYRDALNGQ